MRNRLAVNAALNVLTGVSSAVFAFVVPVLLSHRIDSSGLSIWSIVLQTSAYVAPFTFGIQSVLSRHVAVAHERADSGHRESLETMTVALRMLGFAAMAYLVLGLAAAWALDRIYPALPSDRLTEARIAFGLYIVGQATLIPAAGLAGYFFGVQRNLVVTLNVIGSKLLAGAAIVLGADWLGLPIASGLAAAVTAGFSLALYRRYISSVATIKRSGAPLAAMRQVRAQLVRECVPISVWALATFLIYGGSTSLASLVDFAGFPAYAMASGMSMLLLGLHGAAFGPFIPHVAVVAERGGGRAVTEALSRASMLSALISVTTVAAFALFGEATISLLVPREYRPNVTDLLTILLIGNSVRLIGLPYANTLIGLGMQGKILWTPVIEAGAAFGAAIVLGGHYGLVGVAWSMTIGGVASVLVHLVVNMRVTRDAVPEARPALLAAAGPVAVAWLIFALLDRTFGTR
jgi:O-antigen/teichoic acid export membrane protein